MLKMKIREAIDNLKNNVIYPVYYLKGNDHFLQHFFIDELSEKYFGSSKKEKILMLPDDMSGKEMVDKLTTTDLFSDKKIFIIRDPQKVKGKASVDLVNICKEPIGDHIIVLVNDDWASRSSFFNKIESFLPQIDVQTPFFNDVKKWAKYFIKKRGKISNSYVEELLVNMAGDSLMHLDNEVEKICLIIGDRNNIEAEDIQHFSGWKRDRQRWEFLLALGNRNYSKSISLGRSLINKSESMLSLLIPLTALFQEMLFYKLKNGTLNDFSGYIPLSPSVKKQISNFSRLFEIVEIENALKFLGEIDNRQKSAYSKDEAELIQFIGNVIG